MSQLSQSQHEFPYRVLPDRVCHFVLEASQALRVDPALIGGPCLAALAGCIGNQRRIVVNPGSWTEACVLWVGVVLRSGGKKTPAISLVMEHLCKREAASIKASRVARKENEGSKRTRRYKPKPPARFLVSDATTEAVLSVHASSPMGLLLHRDELAGWVRSFNQYKGRSKGGDAQAWTEMHSGKPALVDRKGDDPLSVPRASVSICGGIQPEILREAIGGEHLYDGIASRILFIVPKERPKEWSEDTISEETRDGWANLLDELLVLHPKRSNKSPLDLPMTPKAKKKWISYYDAHAKREHQANGPLRSTLSKLEAATARLALVMQLADDPKARKVGAKAMKAGIALSLWFEGQAELLYRQAEEEKKQNERQDLYNWIEKKGGSITKRDLSRLGPFRFRQRAEEALEGLVAAKMARKKRKGARGALTYSLCDCDNCDR